MISWLKNITKEYPEFWKEYLSQFEKKTNRYVVFATEKTGLDSEIDVILSFGCFGVVDNAIYMSDSFEVLLSQNKFLNSNNLPNEYIMKNNLKEMKESLAMEAFIRYIGSATLVSYRIDIDVEIINNALERINCGRLKNEPLDLEIMHRRIHDNYDKQFTLDELYTFYNVTINDRSSALEDAYKMGLLFLKLKSRLGLK